jgi:solute carrier family 8 (sodium/calcium exchanger)
MRLIVAVTLGLLIARADAGGVCMTTVDTLGAPDTEDSVIPEGWQNEGATVIGAALDYDYTAPHSTTMGADGKNSSNPTLNAAMDADTTETGLWLENRVVNMKQHKVTPKYLCDANRGLDSQGGLYYIGRCGQTGTRGNFSDCTRNSDHEGCKTCGKIEVLEFAQGNMILEYNEGEEPCSGGMFLPFFPGEMMWNKGPHLFIFFITLIMSFLGIAIIADVFMAAIETITSKTKEVNGVEVKVWNDTVANLTLMALGSSAPEILLSVLETVGLLGVDAAPGGLGPGTIVGSAAFNLLVIIGICVMCIPGKDKDEHKLGTRTIKVQGVFNITAFFSVFAYIWLFICVMDDNVALWEAFVTLLQFPILVWLCYKEDKKASSRAQVKPEGFKEKPTVSNAQKKDKEALAKALLETEAAKGLSGLLLEKKSGPEHKKEMQEARQKLAHMAAAELKGNEPKSALQSKIEARRALAGKQRVSVKATGASETLANMKSKGDAANAAAAAARAELADNQHGKTLVEFTTPEYAVPEAQPHVELSVTRYGNVTTNIVVYYTTKDGTAQSGEDFVHTRGKLEFKPGVTELKIKVPLIDDTEFEPDEDFFVQLKEPKTGAKGDKSDEFEFGSMKIAKVTILNDDDPGTFSFAAGTLQVREDGGFVPLTINRINGASGSVTLNVSTEDGTAHSQKEGDEGDFIALNNFPLTFAAGEMSKDVKVQLVDDDKYEKSETFNVKFEIAPGVAGVKAGEFTSTEVTILGDEELAKLADEIAGLMAEDFEHTSLQKEDYLAQFQEAMNVAGEEGEDPGLMDYVMHFLTFGWKVMFATCPPTSYYGGWLTFGVALCMIGVITAFVADIAGIFGCLLGLDDAITAITFVALGTSLPDTFASKSAAVGDETADNSVGNVTGSNAVNVYLGLGVPWVIATVVNSASGFAPMGTCEEGGNQGAGQRDLIDRKVAIGWTKSAALDLGKDICNNADGSSNGWFIKPGNTGDYPMAAGALGFSVVIFCICAIVCIGTLYLRRSMFGNELGGQGSTVTGLFFFGLWMVYVVVSSLQTEGHIESFI